MSKCKPDGGFQEDRIDDELTNRRIEFDNRPKAFIGMRVFDPRDKEWGMVEQVVYGSSLEIGVRFEKQGYHDFPYRKVLLPGEPGCPVDPAQDNDWQVGDEFWVLNRGEWEKRKVSLVDKKEIQTENSKSCYWLNKNHPVLRIPRQEEKSEIDYEGRPKPFPEMRVYSLDREDWVTVVLGGWQTFAGEKHISHDGKNGGFINWKRILLPGEPNCPPDPKPLYGDDWQVGDEFWQLDNLGWGKWKVIELQIENGNRLIANPLSDGFASVSGFSLRGDEITVLRIPRIEPPVLTRETLEKVMGVPEKQKDIRYRECFICPHDVYPGTTPANGDLKFEFAPKGTSAPVIQCLDLAKEEEPIEKYLLRECATVTPKGSYSHFPLPDVYHSTHCPNCHREACMCERDEEPTAMLKDELQGEKIQRIEIVLSVVAARMDELRSLFTKAKDSKALERLEEATLWIDDLIDYFWFRAETGMKPEDD